MDRPVTVGVDSSHGTGTERGGTQIASGVPCEVGEGGRACGGCRDLPAVVRALPTYESKPVGLRAQFHGPGAWCCRTCWAQPHRRVFLLVASAPVPFCGWGRPSTVVQTSALWRVSPPGKRAAVCTGGAGVCTVRWMGDDLAARSGPHCAAVRTRAPTGRARVELRRARFPQRPGQTHRHRDRAGRTIGTLRTWHALDTPLDELFSTLCRGHDLPGPARN